MQREELGGKERKILGKIKGKVGGRGEEGKRKKIRKSKRGSSKICALYCSNNIISSCNTSTQLLHPF